MAKTRCNGEGSIRQRPDGRFEARVSGGVDFRTGKPIRISRYANTQEEAIRLLHQMNLSVGNHNISNQNITLGDWLDLWMAVYMKNNLKQSTYASYETFARRHFKPSLGLVRLTDITPQLLQQFYNYKIQTEQLSPKTITNMNLYLHKALDQAYKEGIIPANPASALNLPKTKRHEVEILTRDEQERLMYASYSHRYGVFVRLVLATGLRVGELLGLRWEDIDLQRSMLHVRRTLNRLQKTDLPEGYAGPRTEIVLQEPKTENSIRTIPLVPGIMQDLTQWKAIQGADKAAAGDAYTDSGMIVTNVLGGYIEPRTFADYYHQMLQMAGLRPFTFHALRHTFASRALEQGMDFKTLSMLLGHYSVAFTMDTYAHVLDDHKFEAMKLMEELFPMKRTPAPQGYTILFTPSEDGRFLVTAPDFPGIQTYAPSVEDGLAQISEELRDALAVMPCPPIPTHPGSIPLYPGQFFTQIEV